MFAREASRNTAIINSLTDAVFFKVDCEKGEGVDLAEKYGIRGYPTFITVNGKGEVTDSWIGFDGPGKWAASVEAAKKDPRTIDRKTAAYQAEPTLELALALASHASTTSRYKAAVQYYDQARKMDPAHAAEYRDQILMSMIYGLEDDSFTMDDVVVKARPVMDSDQTPVPDKMELALMMKYFAGKNGQMDKALPFIEAAWDASEGSTDEEVIKYRQYMAVDHALLVEKDTDKALALYRERLPEGWREDPEQLNKFAWWCFQNDVNLEEAQKMAHKGVELAASDGEKANILDTAAEICYALGYSEEALQHIKDALELAPDQEHLQDQLTRFEKASQEKKKG